jgi:hypothetical protein
MNKTYSCTYELITYVTVLSEVDASWLVFIVRLKWMLVQISMYCPSEVDASS